MTFLAWMLLFASTSRVDLVDETYVIPAANWRYIELELKQLPVTVFCDYHAGPGSTQVRLALMRRREQLGIVASGSCRVELVDPLGQEGFESG